MRVPGWMPATEEMNTIEDPSSSTGSADRAVNIGPRRLTANTRSQLSADVPASSGCSPTPTL
jgi:hypothetical protein